MRGVSATRTRRRCAAAGHPGNLLADLVQGVDVGGTSSGGKEGEDELERIGSSVVAVADAAALLDDARDQVEACVAAGPGSSEDGSDGTYAVEAWDVGGDDALVYRITSRGRSRRSTAMRSTAVPPRRSPSSAWATW